MVIPRLIMRMTASWAWLENMAFPPDGLYSRKSWEDHEIIVQHIDIYVSSRPGFPDE
jgi:hypothetical protein